MALRTSGALGLIAGDGAFPAAIAASARSTGRRVAAVAFRGITHPALESQVDACHWLALGQVDALIEAFRAAGVTEVVMAGKVAKTHLFGSRAPLEPDARATRLLAALSDRNDDTILRALTDELEREGFSLRPQNEWAPALGATPGPLGAIAPTAAQVADLRYAWPIAKALGALDVGQTVVVKDRAVLALEAIEGTDAAIARGGDLAGGGAVVVKVAKPNQDPRFDLPAIGPATLAAAAAAKVAVLGFEARGTVVLERSQLVARADGDGIALVGLGADGSVDAVADATSGGEGDSG
ncbi:MAG: UDP-2,3-diacylglucosamine diphosphatase LpxI [Proteobacteria bacterium]|nr:UDP-2,3-diacylglucosamine diphosphatase LpxI [Pseudomonadota bacterium]